MASNAYRLALSIGIAGVAFIALGVILGWAVLPLVVKNKIADVS